LPGIFSKILGLSENVKKRKPVHDDIVNNHEKVHDPIDKKNKKV
jgi:hypothetical protein